METNVNYTVVGAFVIIILTFIILSIIWLSAGFSADDSMYKVYMTESVSGLSPDSAVEYNGVNVGKVKTIQLNKKNPQLVELLLSIKKSTPITQGTVATLNAKGLTGIAIIALQDKGANTAPLVALKGEEYPIIKTAPSFFLRLDKAITQLNNNLHGVSQSIKRLLDEENLHSLREILLNLKDLTGTFAGNKKNLNAIFYNTAVASQQFAPLMQSTNHAMQEMISQTIPAANAAVGNLKSITANLAGVASEIKQNPAVLIRGKTPRKLGPGE
jgi:phospholipid/cholesterol/gamma-HCH transport system substrate-binding protein